MTRWSNLIRRLIGTVDPLEFSQFTMDWIEEQTTGLDYYDDDTLDYPDDVMTLPYKVDNILAVMRPDLPDFAFFQQVKEWLSTIHQ